jgi:DNA-binding CsgD family transcriptional regulator
LALTGDWIGAVEAAYRLEPSPTDWLSDIAERCAALMPAKGGAMVYTFDARQAERRGVRLGAWAGAGVPASFVEATLELNRCAPWDQSSCIYGRGIVCGTVSEVVDAEGRSLADSDAFAAIRGRGWSDSFGLTASGPDRRGVVVNAPLAERLELPDATRARWRRLAVHLQAAHRLRARLGLASSEADATGLRACQAVVAPGGDLLHAEGPARPSDARAALRAAAQRLDEARRASVRSDPDRALALWRGLVEGRWSLVERFDSDDRRYFVALPNPPEVRDPRALTEREDAVVALVAQGDPNKWVAYQLGITPGAVATLLARAMRKLGFQTRAELIWAYQRLTASEGAGTAPRSGSG